MKFRSAVVLLLPALLLSALIASAQTVAGTLSGHVNDSSGAVMPGVKVVAKNDQTGTVRDATTNELGYYLMSFLPIGSYQVRVAVQGFKTVEKQGIAVELNKNTVSDFTLEPGPVSMVVEVQGGEIPLIETTVGELKHSLGAREIENTPLAGRNFISLVEQIPGFQNTLWTDSQNNPTNSSGSYAAFNGTGGRSATFQIDGVNNDDSSENQNRQNVNISTIKEFQVLTNAYSAEFGRAGGAVVLVETKSGTNSFHGEAYDFIQNDVFNAQGFFQNSAGRDPTTNQPLIPKQKIRRNEYGWTVGGPILQDRLFFFNSGERVANIGYGTITRFIWLPSDGPRACNAGEVARPGGPYCVDPATHPNLQRDLAFMQKVMDLWKTPELAGKTPNDPVSCADMISSLRANRCVTVSGLRSSFPDSDYSGRLDWNAPWSSTVALRYQYSRQFRNSPRIIEADNFGSQNNRQYNLGLTAVHVFSPRQTGEFRFGFGNRTTLQDVTDGNNIPTIRFANMLYTAQFSDTVPFVGTVIGTSTNVPINRRQHDQQYVYNHTLVFNRHTLRSGIDQRFSLLDDTANAIQRGFWTFSTLDSITSIRNRTGFAGWENFLRGFVTGFQQGFGDPRAENRFGETNLYVQDDFRLRRNLTLNLGARWEGVRAPEEIKHRFSYGYGGDWNNIEPRIGFAWTPEMQTRWPRLQRWLGGPGNFVIRGGYGIYHGRIFQSVFSQSGSNLRSQPPNGFLGSFGGLCRNEISDPSCGFVFTPGAASRSVAAACSLTAVGCSGVKVQGGQLQTILLLVDPKFHMPYVEQWNLTLERRLPGRIAIQWAYIGNRGIGVPYFDGSNVSQFPINSPLVLVDVGGGNFQPLVFDRVCKDFSDPVCLTLTSTGVLDPNTSGALKSFSSLTSTTATLAQKGIVIVNGVPHGYISSSSLRAEERRPDPNFTFNLNLRNFGWSYYHASVLKVTKSLSRGLSFTASWTLSKAIDTGSETTTTNVDVQNPAGKKNAAQSIRGLSSFDARHRVVINYSYELPWMKSQQGWLGRIVGGWTVSGVNTFQSGSPFTVVAGYDVNLDNNIFTSDRPAIGNPAFLFRSLDNGRAQSPCPTSVTSGPCPDTLSQLQVPGSVFIPAQAAVVGGDQRFLDPGGDGTGSIGRNTFFTQGLGNWDMAMVKSMRVRERMSLQVRMEWYNLFNRVTFGLPARTIQSSTPLGRITSQRNPQNYVNSARIFGSRMGQIALRITF